MFNRFFQSRLYGIVLLLLISVQDVSAVTLVYNLRIRRAFDVPPSLRNEFKYHWLLSALPIVFFRTSHITNKLTKIDVCEDRKVGGSLFNIRYVPNRNWWFEVTTGIEKDSATFRGNDAFKASRVGVDDIVFAGGPRFFVGDKTQFALYGLVGLPTRRKLCKVDRYGPLVGTRLYNAGLGAEVSCSFYNEIKRSCSGIIQGRFIHSFNRSWSPVLPCGSKIQPGNFSDILVALQFREKLTLVEFGYDGTFFTHQAVITPTKQKIKSDSFLRNSGYINIMHGWLDALAGNPFILGAGLNVGRASQFNAKTVSAWLNATLVF